jgi:MscS family membrane protein
MESYTGAAVGDVLKVGRIRMANAGAILLIIVSLAGQVAAAQEEGHSLAIADTSSPRATLETFIDSCNEFYKRTKATRYFDRSSPHHRLLIRRITDCLDTRELPDYAREEIAAEAAVCLKEILDRVPLPTFEEIPDIEAIEAAGGPEKLSRWLIPGTRLMIAEVEEGPSKHEYLFTPGTLERVADYYEEIETLPYRTTGPDVSQDFYRWYDSAPGKPSVAVIVDRLPQWTQKRAFGLSIWKWGGLLLASLISIVIMAIAYQLQRSFGNRWRGKHVYRYGLTIVFPVGAALVPLVFKQIIGQDLTIRGAHLYVASFSANLVTLLAAVIVIFGTGPRIAAIIIASPRVNPKGLNAQLIRIACKLASILAIVILFLEGGQYLGIPVTTLLASAGVGGLAVALAAQDTLKTLFGTIMLMADKPFRVGERIIFGKYDGVVEDIGLRSTRIRLLTGHQASIPNDELTRTDIENVGRRPHIRRVTNVRIPLDTPAAKLEKAVSIIEAALEQHEGMDPEFPPRVSFNDFNSDSFNIRVCHWYSPPNYWDFLKFSERLNLKICRAFEEQGIGFSLPFRITHTSVDSEEKPVEVRVVDG